jgi:hypothetical protein
MMMLRASLWYTPCIPRVIGFEIGVSYAGFYQIIGQLSTR